MTDKTTVLTGDGIQFFQLAQLKARLKLEMKGLKVSHGPSAYSILKSAGYKGSRQSVLEQVELLVQVHQLDGLEVHREHWPVAMKLVAMGRITLGGSRGPENAWRRAEPCGKAFG